MDRENQITKENGNYRILNPILMRNMLFLLSLYTFLACSDEKCFLYGRDYLPKNLSESLDYLECTLSKEYTMEFARIDESDLGLYHLSLGKTIRNQFRLWEMNTDLFHEFRKENIINPEAISWIIMKSFHRKLNEKDIALDEQIQQRHDEIKKAEEERKKREIQSKEYFESFEINDTVLFAFDISHKEQKKMVFLQYDKPTKYCLGKGVVATKEGKDKFYGYRIKIKLLDYCDFANLHVNDTIISKGDTINYYIERYHIKNTSRERRQ